MSESLKRAGYNLKEIKRMGRRRRISGGVRIVLICLVVGSAIGLLVDYLAWLPRERFARDFGYWERVKLGATKAWRVANLSLSAYHSDPKTTELPIAEIYIKGKRLDNLTEDLPESGAKFQTAKIQLDGEEYSARARFRGDSINHWAFPNRSWRVQLTKGKFYDGMQSINFNVPRVRTQLSNWLGYEMARKIPGLLVPRAEFVHFRVNRQYDGVRMLLEQPNMDFLRARNLPQHKIFIGDIDSEHIYGGVKRKLIYRDASGWTVRAPSVETGVGEMRALVRTITQHATDPYRLFYQLRRIIDVDVVLKYMALLEIVGSVHIDETHNGKYYFNPVDGRFVPIVWDTVAYMWKNKKGLDLGTNSLFRALLSIPEFRDAKDRYIWNALQGELGTENVLAMVGEQVNKLRSDLYAFPLKLHANDKGVVHVSNEEWEESIQELGQVITERNGRFIDELSDARAAYKLSSEEGPDRLKHLLAIEVRSRTGVQLDQVTLLLKDQSSPVQGKLVRRGLKDILKPVSEKRLSEKVQADKGELTLVLGDTLYSRRVFDKRRRASVVPTQYVYEISLPPGVEIERVEELQAFSTVSGNRVQPIEDASIKIPSTYKKNSVWWTPDRFVERETKILKGRVDLEKSLILNEYQNLTIEPGTVVRMGDGVSIVLRGGSLKAVGSPSEPIRFQPLNRKGRWGVLAVNGGAHSELRHVQFRGGSEARVAHIRYDAPLSLYNATVSVSDAIFHDAYVSARNSDVDLTRVEFDHIYPFNVRAENSAVRELDVQKVGYKPVTKWQTREAESFGTPARVEREFKHSVILGEDSDIPLEDLAKRIQKALRSAVKQREIWKAPEFAGSEFYVDQEVKDFAFRDIYFDTAEDDCYENAISYRFRNRYTSLKGYKRYVKNQAWSAEWPYRLEFQAKTGRQELGDGFSTVNETRFEFRKESLPFSEHNLPPPAPWHLDEFIPYFQAGHYKGLRTLPAKMVMETLTKQNSKQDLFFEPRLVLLTERFRQHLNIKSPWGSGPNPEQSYIISLDQSLIYDGPSYLKFLKARELGVRGSKTPPELGRLVEIEIEFERNTSDQLDAAIREAKQKGAYRQVHKLERAREAFLSDQQTIMKVVQQYFAKKGIRIVKAQKSKYGQAVDLARKSPYFTSFALNRK